MVHNFTVIGEPVAKQRPRVLRSGHSYTPDKTVNYCNMVKWAFQQSVPDTWLPINRPVSLRITAYFTCPKANMKKNGGMKNLLKATKPDVDNIAKSIMDSLNKLAWNDDGCVYECTISKMYTTEIPRCEVSIIYQ